jgi:hypothetical protein
MFDPPILGDLQQKIDIAAAGIRPAVINFCVALVGGVFAVWAKDRESFTIFGLLVAGNGLGWMLYRDEIRRMRMRMKMFSADDFT